MVQGKVGNVIERKYMQGTGRFQCSFVIGEVQNVIVMHLCDKRATLATF